MTWLLNASLLLQCHHRVCAVQFPKTALAHRQHVVKSYVLPGSLKVRAPSPPCPPPHTPPHTSNNISRLKVYMLLHQVCSPPVHACVEAFWVLYKVGLL